jgi:hypothetical protein
VPAVRARALPPTPQEETSFRAGMIAGGLALFLLYGLWAWLGQNRRKRKGDSRRKMDDRTTAVNL